MVDRIAERMHMHLYPLYPASVANPLKALDNSKDYYPNRAPQGELGAYPKIQWEFKPPMDNGESRYKPIKENDFIFTPSDYEAVKGRKSYEGPISFVRQRSQGVGEQSNISPPLNPRGRTGVCGKGALPKWGCNHEMHVLITRFDPSGSHALQVAAIVHHRGVKGTPYPYEKEPFIQLPNSEVNENEIQQMAKSEGKKEELMHLRLGSAKRMMMDHFKRLNFFKNDDGTLVSEVESVMSEVFRSGGNTLQAILHTGYKDDARNTDNAWVETTVVHVHCSHELGGEVKLEPFSKAHTRTSKDKDSLGSAGWMFLRNSVLPDGKGRSRAVCMAAMW